MNVTFYLVQGLIQYNQSSVQAWTKMNYKKKFKKTPESYDWITTSFFA